MFNFDETKLPDVHLENEWMLTSGDMNQVYRAGNWSFEAPSDADIEVAEEAIYAWLAWKKFLESSQQDAK